MRCPFVIDERRSVNRSISVSPDMTVETLVERHPPAVSFLQKRGIICVKCGEPVWGTVGEAIVKGGLDVRDVIVKLEAYLASGA